ncbi:hypothetical protein [Intrasporangium sp. DVR]|uniref:hypothetical protein n=1 Tax=Intrasporangium sp. DVR TaxID=3127867 RepID=UPI00313A5EB8
MFRTKPTRSERLKMQVVEAREHAAATASELGHTAGERLAVMREQATPVAAEAAERVKTALDEAKLRAAPVAADLADRARPKVESAQSTLVESVLPKVGAAIGVASAALAQGADEAKERMRESADPRVQHARETAKVSGDRVRDAYRVLSGEAVAKPVRRGRRTWLIVIGLGAAAVAAVAAYRRQQADDPWATPVSGSTTGAPTGYDTSSSLKDKAAEKVGTAKDAVVEAAAKAKDKASDLAAKGQAAVADAKDRSDDLVTDTEMERASTLADEELDESTGAVPGMQGEVTAVDSTLGSDAIDGSVGTLPSETSGSTPRPKA